MSEYVNGVLPALRKMRKLLAKGWCQGPMAKDKGGNEVSPYSESAVQFCMGGAHSKVFQGVYDPEPMGTTEFVLQLVACQRNYESYVRWNERPGRTHRQVIQFMDAAIAYARKLRAKT